jgi:alcohol oxidase
MMIGTPKAGLSKISSLSSSRYSFNLQSLKKSETYHVQSNDLNHGYDGPLHVSYGDSDYKLADDYIEAAKRNGLGSTIDVNDFHTVNKAGRWPKWINPETSKRSDAAHGFVHPVGGNLLLLTECKVVRILFEGTRAVGVETSKLRIHARRFAIISAGALSTPQILQRSGIGDAANLNALNIPVIASLPGVGQNYQDHQLLGKAAYRVDAPIDDTVTVVFRGSTEALADRPLARNYVDAGIKLRPTEEEVLQMGPAFQKVWKEFFLGKPDKPVMWIGMFST